jgi:hypothetical protein
MRLPVGKKASRRSIAVYFYTEERAADYYQRPQPAHIRAGHTLTGEDRGEIETLLARRDGTIRFLYEREHARAQVTAKALEAVTGSLSFRLGRALTVPARAVRSLLRRHPKS